MSEQDWGYTIGQRVTLVEPALQGRIVGITQDSDGILYRVVYWDDAVRRVEWVFAFEIRSISTATIKET